MERKAGGGLAVCGRLGGVADRRPPGVVAPLVGSRGGTRPSGRLGDDDLLSPEPPSRSEEPPGPARRFGRPRVTAEVEAGVQLNDFKCQWEDVREGVVEAVERVGASGWYILGEEVRKFERDLAASWEIAIAVGVGNGLDAIEVALRACEVPRGAKVLTTPLSAFATSLAIIRAGCIPVFVDVDELGLIDLEKCREALHRDREIRAAVPVHLYGFAIDPEALRLLVEEFDICLIEDCAQSVGAEWNGCPTGHAGRAAATSFYPTKNLGAMGDGGAILTELPDVAEKARAIRNYGQRATYSHELSGLNSRLDELHAAILSGAMLPRLAGWTERRREIAAKYLESIRNPQIVTPRIRREMNPCWHLFPVRVAQARREAFLEYMSNRGIATGIHYPRLIPSQRALEKHEFEVLGSLAMAEMVCRSEVSLPIHPYLTGSEVDRVISACNEWQ